MVTHVHSSADTQTKQKQSQEVSEDDSVQSLPWGPTRDESRDSAHDDKRTDWDKEAGDTDCSDSKPPVQVCSMARHQARLHEYEQKPGSQHGSMDHKIPGH